MDSREEERSESAGLLCASFPETESGEGLTKAVARVRSALDETRDGPLLLTGLHGGTRALLLAGWFRDRGQTGLVVTPDRESADQLADDLETWLGPAAVIHLPQQEVMAFDHNSPEPALVGDFLTGLDRLGGGKPHLVITSVYALRQRVMAKEVLAHAALRLESGQRVDIDDFCLRLSQRGYRPAGMVAKVGDYARRGGLLDIFTPARNRCVSNSLMTKLSPSAGSTLKPSARPPGRKPRSYCLSATCCWMTTR